MISLSTSSTRMKNACECVRVCVCVCVLGGGGGGGGGQVKSQLHLANDRCMYNSDPNYTHDIQVRTSECPCTFSSHWKSGVIVSST